MCFSIEADLVVGTTLLPVAVLTLAEVRTRRELPFAALPLIFCLHQFTEAFVWLGLDGSVSSGIARAAALVYALIAYPLLPLLLPTSVVLLEPREARHRVLPFVGLGAVVAGVLTYATLSGPIEVKELDHAISYGIGLPVAALWAVLYVVAVIGPALLSGYRSIVAFGVLNLVGLSVVAILYTQVFASLWCVYAALASVLALVHMRRRRRLPDPHRLGGAAHTHRGAATTRV